MQQKAIVFDFFGVICSEVAPFWFQKYFNEDAAKKLKEQYVKDADLGRISQSELMERLSKLVDITPQQAQNEWFSYTNINRDIVALIKELKTTKKIGLCSNASADFLHPLLEQNGLQELFDVVVVSSDLEYAKPAPEMYHAVLQALGVEPQDAVMIDDNPDCVAGAKWVGMQGILFTGADDLRAQLV